MSQRYKNSKFEFQSLFEKHKESMINKNSLLDAYIALDGSPLTHCALLVALIVSIRYPKELDDDNEFKEKCVSLFWMGQVTHGFSVVLFIANRFKRFKSSASGQVISIAVVLLNIFSVAVALDLFLEMQTFDYKERPLHPEALIKGK